MGPIAYVGDLTQAEVQQLEEAKTDPVWHGCIIVVHVLAHASGKESRRISGCACNTDVDVAAQHGVTRPGRYRKRARGISAKEEGVRTP